MMESKLPGRPDPSNSLDESRPDVTRQRLPVPSYDEAGLALAWEADPHLGPVGDMAAPLLERFGDDLGHIRLVGGGPEVAMQDGAGIGDLMRRLALGAYAGTVILAPSTPRYGVAWQHWLGRRGGTGCGSAGETRPALVTLEAPLKTGAST